MWSRNELKERAKGVLRNNYFSALLVSIVIFIAGGYLGSGSGYKYDDLREPFFYINFIFSKIIITTSVIILILRILVGYSLEVGGKRYFVKSAEDKDNTKCFSFGFDGNNYAGIVKTMLITKIFIFLWTLLLIIPGIIKSYAYNMVPYILAENPNIGVMEAIKLSNEMTRGHKFDMFILDLSFIGWYLLGILAFGVGVIFVMPYYSATIAELYLKLRRDALRNNLCSYEDLLLDRPNLDNNDMY